MSSKEAILAAVPALLMAATAYFNSMAAYQAKASETHLGDNYQGYIEDRERRDQALARAIRELQKELDECRGNAKIHEAGTVADIDTSVAAAMPGEGLAGDAVRTEPRPESTPGPAPSPEPIDLDTLAMKFGYRYY